MGVKYNSSDVLEKPERGLREDLGPPCKLGDRIKERTAPAAQAEGVGIVRSTKKSPRSARWWGMVLALLVAMPGDGRRALEVLRNTRALLRVVAGVLNAGVAARGVVANDGLARELGRAIVAVFGIGVVLVAVVVVVSIAAAIGDADATICGRAFRAGASTVR